MTRCSKIFLTLFLLPLCVLAQNDIELIDEINIERLAPNTVNQFWLKMIDDGMSRPVTIPVIIVKGNSSSPVLGLTAAIHGNELNGIRVIQRVLEEVDVDSLEGTILAIPGLNGISVPMHQRRYFDDEDINRKLPGKENGNRSQQYAWAIGTKILPNIDYLVDMHTASFGRENTLYVRADLDDAVMSEMAFSQGANIVLNNSGTPSAGQQAGATRTLRAEAVLNGIPTITVEYGNPQVYQSDIIERGVVGIENLLNELGMSPSPAKAINEAVVCEKSYWIYLDAGGYLEVLVDLNQRVSEGELLAVLRNPFGELIKEYFAPEDGIIIGRSSNPINMSGGRIVHLGIVDEGWRE